MGVDRRADASSSWRYADTQLRTAYALVISSTGDESAGEQADAQVQNSVAGDATELFSWPVEQPS